jgi:hypothetical protein
VPRPPMSDVFHAIGPIANQGCVPYMCIVMSNENKFPLKKI